jgi:hypothetical protein
MNTSYKTIALSFAVATLFSGTLLAKDCQCEKPKVPDCDLKAFKDDMAKNKDISVADDPAGVALQSTQDLSGALKKYASDKKCHLYVIDLDKLTQGLLKDSNITSENNKDKGKDNQKKYIAMMGDKARCASKLGLKLPIAVYPNEKK